jgi:uncharacterized protein (DUF433 family)
MDWHIYIEQKPEVLRGKPVFKGTRLSVQLVLERLADGWTTADLLASFPTLRPEHIQAALACAAEALSPLSVLSAPESKPR